MRTTKTRSIDIIRPSLLLHINKNKPPPVVFTRDTLFNSMGPVPRMHVWHHPFEKCFRLVWSVNGQCINSANIHAADARPLLNGVGNRLGNPERCQADPDLWGSQKEHDLGNEDRCSPSWRSRKGIKDFEIVSRIFYRFFHLIDLPKKPGVHLPKD